MRYPKWLAMLCTIGLLCLQTTLAHAAPQNGWWWNPNQSGRAFSIEIQGNTLFMAGYLYENDGRATWLLSGGTMQNATNYAGRLLSFSNGQTLTGNYQAPGAPSDAGAVTLQFSDDTHATLTWPGGSIAIERFRYSSAATASFQPEKGWWWNAAESGRAFFMEVQGDKMFIVGYMYDANGNPVWYVSGGAMTSPTSYQGDWLQFANGQTLSGPYVAPSAPVKAGAISVNFSAPGQATLTLSDNQQPAASKTVAITPFLTKQPLTTGTAVATAVGVPSGSVVSATIGAAGGSVSTPDGKITLTIPAGALTANTLISIQPISNNAHGRLGAGYRLTPDGQTFAQPVVLKFSYTDQDLAGSDPEILGAAFQTAAGFWQWLGTPTIDRVARTMSISTTHFTDFSMVQGYRLQPLAKTLKVNESLALQVAFCYPYPETGSDLTPLGLSCDTAASQVEVAAPFVISEWSVNGVLGGGGATGTVSGNGPSATYKAPAAKPTPNIVAVSARVNLNPKRKTLVVSNITITEGDSWTGTANYKDDVGSASAEITWTLVSRENNIALYKGTGTGILAYDDGTCSYPPTSGSFGSPDSGGSGILSVDFNNTPPTYHGLALVGWPVTVTCVYSGRTETVVRPVALPVFGGSKGPDGVEAAGSVTVPLNPNTPMTIEGSDTDGMGGIFNWKFTRGQ